MTPYDEYYEDGDYTRRREGSKMKTGRGKGGAGEGRPWRGNIAEAGGKFNPAGCSQGPAVVL